ncbi:MAG: hypothetical protein HZB65_00750 [Candidatus Aenigmarchaeota archaeon]|nr:hypothetical protein [Candidatus Aenigmarchaeota archaeon]
MYCKDGIIGDNPLDVITPKDSWNNPRQEVLDRFNKQILKLVKRRSVLSYEFDKEHCKFLETLLRQPIYTTIDLLRLKNGVYPSKDGRPLTKAECCCLVAEQLHHSEINDDLFLVFSARTKYRQFMADHESNDKGSFEEYYGLLREIDDLYSNAMRVMIANRKFLLD